MNLEDLAKKTINEVSFEIEEQQRQKEALKSQELEEEKAESGAVQPSESEVKEEDLLKKELQENNKETEIKQQILCSNLKSEEKKELSSEVLNTSIMIQMQNLGEDIFLKNLRERILVLFEGLNHIKREDLEQRLNLTIHFLEFLLANIEDKLKK